MTATLVLNNIAMDSEFMKTNVVIYYTISSMYTFIKRKNFDLSRKNSTFHNNAIQYSNHYSVNCLSSDFDIRSDNGDYV